MINYLVFFIGTMMVLLSYFAIRRQQNALLTSEDRKMREKEKKLVEYIELAEEIIGELNSVSEQIIQSIDVRTAEMSQLLSEIDKKVKDYKDQMNACKLEVLQKSDSVKRNEDKTKVKREENINSVIEDTNQLTSMEILRLFHEGNNAAQIARQLNKGIGEVQLVLNLRKKQ